jgi:hypothetical protein
MNKLGRHLSVSLPGLAAALLPNLGCPACWPAYAGLLSSLGLGAFINGPFFLGAIIVFLSVSLFGLGWRAKRRRGYGPFIMGSFGAAVILATRLESLPSLAQWAGVAMLISASLWNGWPQVTPKAALVDSASLECQCGSGRKGRSES